MRTLVKGTLVIKTSCRLQVMSSATKIQSGTRRTRDTHLEPAKLNGVQVGLPGMGEQHLEGGLIRHDLYQIFEHFGFPTIQPLVVDFHDPLQMADPKDELLLQVLHLSKHFLVIQPGIPYKTDLVLRIQPVGGFKGLFDLFVLTDKVGRLVGKPVGITGHRDLGVDQRGRDGRITMRQASFSIQVRGG